MLDFTTAVFFRDLVDSNCRWDICLLARSGWFLSFSWLARH